MNPITWKGFSFSPAQYYMEWLLIYNIHLVTSSLYPLKISKANLLHHFDKVHLYNGCMMNRRKKKLIEKWIGTSNSDVLYIEALKFSRYKSSNDEKCHFGLQWITLNVKWVANYIIIYMTKKEWLILCMHESFPFYSISDLLHD